MLDDETVDLAIRIISAAVRCAKCVNYFDATSNSTKEFVTFSQNSFAELAVLHWSTIFGSRNGEPTHYKKYFDRTDVLIVSSQNITSNKCKAHFLSKLSMTGQQYKIFWDQAHDMRNKFVAHRDDLSNVSLPDLDVCKNQCYAILECMRALLQYSIKNGDQRQTVINYEAYLNHDGDSTGIERVCRVSIAEVSQLLK